jgi:cytosine/adenosine deaminase-related metal-dependent hydrolase
VSVCLAEDRGVRLGVQPHAPYSCGPEVYAAAVQTGLPLATHLAETLEELTFVRNGDGALAGLLQRLGVWDDSIVGSRMHPLDYLHEHLAQSPLLAAHLNYLEPRHVELLAKLPISVVYCPRASAYFGHPHNGHGPHRYREMIAAGVNVALGTDSILCLDTPHRLSILDEMRLLHRRDGADPRVLLRMATINGAVALGYDPAPFTFQPGRKMGLLAIDGIEPQSSIDPLSQVLEANAPPRWLLEPAPGEER